MAKECVRNVTIYPSGGVSMRNNDPNGTRVDLLFGDWKSKRRIDYDDDDDDEDEKKRTLRCDRMRKTRDATKMRCSNGDAGGCILILPPEAPEERPTVPWRRYQRRVGKGLDRKR